MTRRLIAVPVAALGTAALVVHAARKRLQTLVTQDVDRLFSHAAASVGPEQLRTRWDGLPDPVRRYFGFAVDGRTPLKTARLRHAGFFRTSPDQRWFPIAGEQYFTAAHPGFVWSASVRLSPFFWIEARDCLLPDGGNMLVKVLSTVTIADARGPEIDQGSGLRWLAECAWFPYALAGEGIQWEPVDARSARATLGRNGLTVSALLEVDDEGKLVELRGDRFRDIGGGKAVLTPWIGQYREYREFSGFQVPTAVSVAWELDTGRFEYARFQIVRLEYNATGRFPRR